jgi:uncharacterized membrane protein YbhN (UPF0104 family)
MMRSFANYFVSSFKFQVQSFRYFVTMIAISHKAKQFLLVLVKLLIVSGALYYIVNQLQGEKAIAWRLISDYFSIKSLFFLLLFSVLNWVFEILKWQHLVSSFTKISFLEAAKQSLGSLTASIFTPNRIGEYGAKALYFDKKKIKKIIFLNFIGNSSQMMVTTFFGVLGFIISSVAVSETMLWLNFKFSLLHLLFLVLFLFVVFLIFKFRKVSIYGLSLQKIIEAIKKLSIGFHVTTLQLSIIRYLIFAHQFYFLLLIFGSEISYSLVLATVFMMYFLASIIPSIHLMDVAIKGSIALFLFGKLGIPEWKMITITSVMWLFNLVIPVVIGSFFVMKYQPNAKE